LFRKADRTEKVDAGEAARAVDRASRILAGAVAALFALTALAQALVASGAVRERISPVDRLEGRPISFAPPHGHVLY